MTRVVTLDRFKGKTSVFEDREHAGELLADQLIEYREDPLSLVVAIPAGGVPVGYVISSRLGLPFTLALTRKLHVPWNQEAGFGAVTWNGVVEINETLVSQLRLSKVQVEEVIEKEKNDIKRRKKEYGLGEFPDIRDRHPILVDDGLASGFSMIATLKAVRKYGPREVTVAVPTAPASSIERLHAYADSIFCLNVRAGLFFAVASAYVRWHDLSNGEVKDYLKKIREEKKR